MISKSIFIVGSLMALLHMAHSAHFKVTSQIYFQVEIDKKPIGRITIGLFGDDAPKTVKNFRHICLKGIDGKTYVGSKFHRIIDKFVIQGGDIVSNDGHGSTSIYGKYFENENVAINHTGPGFLAMANRGGDTNGCQFFITTMAAPWLNGKHTIFGKVTKGTGLVHVIEKVRTNTDDEPIVPVVITECGDEPISFSYTISDNPYDLWSWIRAAYIPLGFSFSILAFFHFLIRRLDTCLASRNERHAKAKAIKQQ